MTRLPAESRHRLVVISPCRNEAETLERTIACMEAQTTHPVLWIVVDDGSTDATPEILEEAAKRIPWLRVVPRSDRGFRQVGVGVIEAFNCGLGAIDVDYDFIAKMDVDLEFSPQYLELLFRRFDDDPLLAAASGKVYRLEGKRLVEEFMIDEMVAGQFKLYRREAFERIGGFVSQVMWDGIDFHRARMEGFRTCSFHDEKLMIRHLRLMGSSERNVFHGRLRWGRGQWFMGSAFPYVVASGFMRMREQPMILGGLLIIAGYLHAAITGHPRYDDLAFRRSLRRWQYRRLGRVLLGAGTR